MKQHTETAMAVRFTGIVPLGSCGQDGQSNKPRSEPDHISGRTS